MKTSRQRLSARQVFATNLRRLRLAAGHSQEAFAGICALHRTYIGAVERGEKNISIDNIERIAGALGCSPADLLTYMEVEK